MPPGTRELSYVNHKGVISAGFSRAMCTGTGAETAPVQKSLAAFSKFVYLEATEAPTDVQADFCD